MKSTWHCLRRSIFYPCLATVLAAASGCTTVPTKEFASYKDTFAQARKAGEDVLVDYGASVSRVDELNAKQEAAQVKPKERGALFDPLSGSKQTAAVDDVAVRMKAWDVVARYNDLLTALAEGKAADQLAAAVDGLSSSLTSFPISEVALSATQVSGYLAPLKPLALEAVREQSRRKFVAAVAEGGPLISDKFLAFMKKDAGKFYQLRQLFNDMEYDPIVDEIGDVRNRFAAVAAKFQPTPDVMTALDNLNQELALLPREPGGAFPIDPVALKPASGSAPPPAPDTVAQLQGMTTDVKGLVSRAVAKDAELDAYREVMTHYVSLLNQLEQSMRALQSAAEQAQPTIPPASDLERTVILLREAYMKYKDIGKE